MIAARTPRDAPLRFIVPVLHCASRRMNGRHNFTHEPLALLGMIEGPFDSLA